MKFNGIVKGMGDLFKLSDAKTRSISPENLRGEKGKGGMAEVGQGSASHQASELGRGWKVNPHVHIKAEETLEIANIEGPGAVQHIWMTATGVWRHSIIRIYWDHQEHPSVESPIGDFFCNGWNSYAPVNSLAVCVNPGSAFNAYWIMPFKKHCRITIENIDNVEMILFYQIDYTLTELPDEVGYFHAEFRRVNPLPYKQVYTIADLIEGKGQYVGTYMAWGVHNNKWWGEGEIKFFMDGDQAFPTICGTGTEDYFCGSYNFENKAIKQYEVFSTPYAGLVQVIRPDGLYVSQQRFGMFRWHITDPIRFEKDLKVTIQALGWKKDKMYLPLQDDIASVAFWYQTLPSKKFKPFYDINDLEII
ncbi:MAG: DUF2961 domain-containing protein [Acholeplasmataceae bacterium]|nr:DUF2961 domain-containing protein [Acholeplasmataceae bacterium]